MRIEADACNPLGNEPRVLSRGDAPSRTAAAGIHKFAGLFGGGPHVVVDSLAGLFRQFEPDGLAGLLLSDRGPIDCVSSWRYILDPEGDDITATELAIDGQIE